MKVFFVDLLDLLLIGTRNMILKFDLKSLFCFIWLAILLSVNSIYYWPRSLQFARYINREIDHRQLFLTIERFITAGLFGR